MGKIRISIFVFLFLILSACGTQPKPIVETPNQLTSPAVGPESTPTPILGSNTSNRNSPLFVPTTLPELLPFQYLQLISISMIDESAGWSITESGHILHTKDGAESWDDATPDLAGPFDPAGFFALDDRTAWAVSYCLGVNRFVGRIYGCPENTSVWITHDEGKTWFAGWVICINPDCSDSPAPFGDDSLRPRSIRFLDSQHGWLVLNRGHLQDYVLYTEDGANHWDLLAPGTIARLDASISVLEPIDSHSVFLSLGIQSGAGNGMQFIRSNDGGKEWSSLLTYFLPDNPLADPAWDHLDCGTTDGKTIPPLVVDFILECSVSTSFYFVHLHSMDAGQNWIHWEQTGDVDFVDAKTGWQMTAKNNGLHEIQQTHDGGRSWSTIKTVQWDAVLDFVDEKVGYALTYDNGVVALLRSVDGGRSWSLISDAAISHPPCMISTWTDCAR